MKRIAMAFATTVLMFSATACDGGTTTYDPDPVDSQNDSGGLGMTYGGKQGIEIMPGYVMPFDGSGMQPGMGY